MTRRLGPALVRWTGRAEGDLGHGGRWVATDGVDAAVAARRAAVLDRPWSWLRQVHGDRVVVVTEPGGGCGEEADAAVTTDEWATLVVFTADCAPVALASPEGVLGVAHVGWKGLALGVLDRTIDAMRALGATAVDAAVGPCIRPECYEFGEDDLDRVAASAGDEVRATTAAGRPALDIVAGVTAALTGAGVDAVHDEHACTACDPDRWFSHRARRDTGRQATLVWRP